LPIEVVPHRSRPTSSAGSYYVGGIAVDMAMMNYYQALRGTLGLILPPTMMSPEVMPRVEPGLRCTELTTLRTVRTLAAQRQFVLLDITREIILIFDPRDKDGSLLPYVRRCRPLCVLAGTLIVAQLHQFAFRSFARQSWVPLWGEDRTPTMIGWCIL
jgi:hypothetical protein